MSVNTVILGKMLMKSVGKGIVKANKKMSEQGKLNV